MSSVNVTMATVKERYEAAMVLSGSGDALGYKNGKWEFCHNGTTIFKELQELGGLQKIEVKLPKWKVSDDTVMLLATGEALMKSSGQSDREKLFLTLATHYKVCMKDMVGRAPGITCKFGVRQLDPQREKGYQIPFNQRAGGCGAAMRAMCIGLRYPQSTDLEDLVAVSVESGRMTHHHPTGYLGALASALFTALAIQGKPLKEWGRCLLDTLPLAKAYVQKSGHAVKENEDNWKFFTESWTEYLTIRNILDGKSDVVFPEKYSFVERDDFYKRVSFSGWGGSCGHDAPMIAYDALLGANWNWEELCKRAMFHGGDSDSTGIIAACCYGATMGFHGIPEVNHKFVEYRSRLLKVAHSMLKLSHLWSDSDDDGEEAGDYVGDTGGFESGEGASCDSGSNIESLGDSDCDAGFECQESVHCDADFDGDCGRESGSVQAGGERDGGNGGGDIGNNCGVDF